MATEYRVKQPFRIGQRRFAAGGVYPFEPQQVAYLRRFLEPAPAPAAAEQPAEPAKAAKAAKPAKAVAATEVTP